MKSKARREREKAVRTGKIPPDLNRNTWERKPITRVVENRKAEKSRLFCRKSKGDGFFVRCRMQHSRFISAAKS